MRGEAVAQRVGVGRRVRPEAAEDGLDVPLEGARRDAGASRGPGEERLRGLGRRAERASSTARSAWPSRGAERDDPLLAPLPEHPNEPAALVQAPARESRELADAKARAVEALHSREAAAAPRTSSAGTFGGQLVEERVQCGLGASEGKRSGIETRGHRGARGGGRVAAPLDVAEEASARPRANGRACARGDRAPGFGALERAGRREGRDQLRSEVLRDAGGGVGAASARIRAKRRISSRVGAARVAGE